MAEPDKQVINVMGDFAFGSVGMDIETAVRAELPIITIVLNNSTMAIYNNNRFPVAVEKYNLKSVGGQFSEVAQALGAYSEKITDPQEIIPAIERALEINRGGQTVLLEFITKEEGEYSKFNFR